MGKPSIRAPLAGVQYNDYLVLLCYSDAEWTRRRVPVRKRNDPEAFLQTHRDFATNCWGYRAKVDKNYASFCAARGVKPRSPLAAHLYNPLCFLPFGHADDLFVVMLDDFDPAHFLMVETRTALEEVCMGFCPKAKTFCPPGVRSIRDLHTLLGKHPPQPAPYRGNRHEYFPAAHDFLRTTPLLVFTRLKLHGLATLGHGLLFQHALFAAMARRIDSTLHLLTDQASKGDVVARLIQEDRTHQDISSLRCVFLDLQGPEEVGTLMFCSNFSVAMSLVLALRQLTFGDVFDADGTAALGPLLGTCQAYDSVIRLNQQFRAEKANGQIEVLRELHVFRWSHSSLAVAPASFFHEAHPHCNGLLEASVGFRISPGHRTRVEKHVGRLFRTHWRGDESVELNTSHYHRCQVGVEDLVVSSTEIRRPGTFTATSLKSVLAVDREILRTFGTLRSRKDYGRNIVDAATNIVLPVPKILERAGGRTVNLICADVDEKKHFSPLASLLPLIQKGLFYASRPRAHPGRKGAVPQLHLGELRHQMPKLGIPIALRRTIEDLYQNLAIVLADPFLFDTVLDMYDMFATLHAVLTKHLLREMKQHHTPRNGQGLGRVDEGRVEQLAMLIHAIQNALVHRIVKIYPEASIREMSIDLRGGLNQVLLAADAPVKCGLGVLRRYALGADLQSGYDRVGGLTCIGFVPGARCHSLKLGVEDQAQLAYFEVDVPHVVHVDSYCENLHEAFHLSFEALRRKRLNSVGLSANDMFLVQDPVMAERLSEVFASLLTQIFIFGSDTDAFALSLMCSYTKSLTSVGLDDFDTTVRLAELLFRVFVVTDAVPRAAPHDPAQWDRNWIRKGDRPERVLSRFQRMVERVGPFYSEFERLWQGKRGEAVRSYVAKQFQAVYAGLERFLPGLWREAMDLYHAFAAREYPGDPAALAQLRQYVREAMRSGRPIIRGLFHRPALHAGGPAHARDLPAPDLSPMLLICAMLHEYIGVIRKARKRAIHLRRRYDSREVEYPRGEMPWHEFQIDRDSAEMFCPVPLARKIRLRKQIAVLKTFWDISSSLRERRLQQMIRDCKHNLKTAGIVSHARR